MKRLTGFLLAALAALCVVSAACGSTPETVRPTVTASPEEEEAVVFATPTPEPVRSLFVSEKTDAETLRQQIAGLPELQSVEIAAGALSNEEIAALVDAYSDLAFRYDVSVGQIYVASNTTEIAVTDGCTVEDIAAALPYLKLLYRVHLGACTPEELTAALALLPEGLTDYSIAIFGREVAPDTKVLDLTEAESPAPEQLAAALPYLPELETVLLGEREDPALAAVFRAAAPEIDVSCRYHFTYLGQELTESTETLDLTKIQITDIDELRRVLSWLPALTHTEMVGCGLDDETMAALRDEFPEKGIVWEISLGFWGTVRTDATAFTTRSSRTEAEDKHRLTTETVQPIQYCTELVALDLGHQHIGDISCLAGLHKLQILILADNWVSDLTPLTSMPDLIYLELFINRITDVTPLAELKNLKDLNICTNHISDLTPFYSMTSLERLYYSHNDFTREDHEALQAALPNCVCDRTVWDETAHGWREHERYFWMRSFFQDCPRYK